MDGAMTGPHDVFNPRTLQRPLGFSHAVLAKPGRTVHIGGQTGHRADGTMSGDGVVEQFDQAAANVAEALKAAGARPEHLVQLVIYVTDVGEYRSSLRGIGEAYRRHLGRHFPAMALIGVSELFDPDAKVELAGVAVVPQPGA